MASQKKNNREKLQASHNAFLLVSKEREGFVEVLTMAREVAKNQIVESSPDIKDEELATMIAKHGIVKKCQDAVSRYDADYEHLAKQRSYYVGKLLESSPSLFNEVLNKILA